MTNWSNFGFTRVSAVFPDIELGQPLANAELFIQEFKNLSAKGSSVLVTPELALTGYTCEDLFHSESLIRDVEKALFKIKTASTAFESIWIVGAPLRLPDGRYLNGAWVFHQGKILGVVPKTSLPNMGEFYERRWFVSGRNVHEKISHNSGPEALGDFWVSAHQIFSMGKVKVGIEICQDLWAPRDPSSALALKGANIILNLSASNEIVGKPAFRRKLIEVQSQRLHCAYVYVSAGTYESSKDTVFSGHTIFAELGTILDEVAPFVKEKTSLSVDLDLERILNARTKDICYLESVEQDAAMQASHQAPAIISHSLQAYVPPLPELKRQVQPYAFLADIPDFEDVIQIQAQGLLRRMNSSHSASMIVGISGGLDSTHALYIALRTRALSGGKLKVIGVTLPGPGTSEKTLMIARTLLKEAAVDQIIEVPISAAVEQQMKDLGKAASDRSIVYENAQARQRTQILFNLANEHKSIVIGTGDLSELALGWCTYNADHMAHYAVNSAIPKTVVKGLVKYWSEMAASRILQTTLLSIVALPISPELLPPDEQGEIAQETEMLIGSYSLHDFFLYHFLNHGFSREKIHALAEVAFTEERDLFEQIPKAIEIFYKRFFSQQFKRTTLPPGPKVHHVSLSPRSDFRLPDEIQKGN